MGFTISTETCFFLFFWRFQMTIEFEILKKWIQINFASIYGTWTIIFLFFVEIIYLKIWRDISRAQRTVWLCIWLPTSMISRKKLKILYRIIKTFSKPREKYYSFAAGMIRCVDRFIRLEREEINTSFFFPKSCPTPSQTMYNTQVTLYRQIDDKASRLLVWFHIDWK